MDEIHAESTPGRSRAPGAGESDPGDRLILQNLELQRLNEVYVNELAQITSSLSWRVTLPVRAIGPLVLGFGRFSRMMLVAAIRKILGTPSLVRPIRSFLVVLGLEKPVQDLVARTLTARTTGNPVMKQGFSSMTKGERTVLKMLELYK